MTIPYPGAGDPARIDRTITNIHRKLFDMKRSSNRLGHKADQLGDRVDNLEDEIDQNQEELVFLLSALTVGLQGSPSAAALVSFLSPPFCVAFTNSCSR